MCDYSHLRERERCGLWSHQAPAWGCHAVLGWGGCRTCDLPPAAATVSGPMTAQFPNQRKTLASARRGAVEPKIIVCVDLDWNGCSTQGSGRRQLGQGSGQGGSGHQAQGGGGSARASPGSIQVAGSKAGAGGCEPSQPWHGTPGTRAQPRGKGGGGWVWSGPAPSSAPRLHPMPVKFPYHLA